MSRFNQSKFKLAGFVILLLIFLLFFGILSGFKNIVFKITQPFSRAFYGLSQRVNDSIGWWQYRESFAEIQNKLELEIKDLALDQVALLKLKEENQILRQNLDFFNQKNYDYKLANLISKTSPSYLNNTDQENLWIIDRGWQDNLKKDYAVIVPRQTNQNTVEGFLVGKIFKVEKNQSWVLPVLANQSKIAAKILSQQQTTGLVEGMYNQNLKMDLIPQDQEIYQGDLVITSGLEPGMPGDLILGRVKEIEETNLQKIFKTALIEPLINFDHINLVTVLIPHAE
ncbi:MAG: rod shape-determining protein MreC [Patescibacteria group bacterium]|nr:rod shape-determining protein MreC [Patescibacteria group bacterium]